MQLSDADIPLADGQEVTVVLGHPFNRASAGQWAVLVNHTAQGVWLMTASRQLVSRWKLVRPWSAYGLGAWVLIGLLPFHLGGFGMLVCLGSCVYHW